MGCRITKAQVVGDQSHLGSRTERTPSDPNIGTHPTIEMFNQSSTPTAHSAEHYKARLERQLCLARETPESDFTLNDCNLREVPTGVFIMCRVLRKEILDLRTNRLRSLSAGGALADLSLLTVLDLRQNQFKRLPEELSQLENLRKLFASNNRLECLPTSLNRLRQLEQLDLAENRLRSIAPVNCLPHLRILDVTGNPLLVELPMELSTCTGLVDIVFSPESVRSPPESVLARGTQAILNYLSGDVSAALEDGDEAVDNQYNLPATQDNVNAPPISTENWSKKNTNDMLNEERADITAAEIELQRVQQQRREQLLINLRQQQNENDALVNKVQIDRDNKRNKLITDIVKAEEISTLAVDKLLSLRTEPDPALLELELNEQAAILEQLRIQHSELRKMEVLDAMSNTLAGEKRHIDAYQQRRDATTRDILRAENDANERLDRVVCEKDRDRTGVVDRIMDDEMLQMAAVGSLIEQNDARSWALMEQVRLVEAQLLRMTQIELDRKQHSVDHQLTELSEQRMNLTCMLLDLMDQQEKRKGQLLDTLHNMENQKRDEEDFWLLQYQKLIDSRPVDHSAQSASLDPLLGYQLLVHGVVHCLPFLAKLMQSKDLNMCEITDNTLAMGGVRNASDRMSILRAIEEYLRSGQVDQIVPSAPLDVCCAEEVKPVEQPLAVPVQVDRGVVDMLAECVVCMERTCKIIFLPCGHLCCCVECHDTLTLCPMCRSEIERRIKVIQS